MTNSKTYGSYVEVTQAIVDGCFPRFCDIPEEFLDGHMAIRWLQKAGLPLEKYYPQVPKQWRTDDFLMFAAYNGCNVLKDTNPSQTSRYRDLIAHCTNNDHTSLRDLDIQFRTDEFLESLFSNCSWVITGFVRDVEWIGQVMSDELLRKCCDNNLKLILDLPAQVFRNELSDYVDLTNKMTMSFFRDRGRIDLLTSALSKKGWPRVSYANEHYEKPNSLSDGIEKIKLTIGDKTSETLFMAYLMTHPIDQVVSTMSGSRLKKLLLEMYSKEALTPYLKHDNGLKGVFLDDAMGL